MNSFKVGQPVTHNKWSDCSAAVVIAVSKSGKRITVQYCTATLLNGPTSGHPEALKVTPGGFAGHTEGRQIWDIQPNPTGATSVFTVRHNGRVKIAGGSATSPGDTLTDGWHHHYDFNF